MENLVFELTEKQITDKELKEFEEIINIKFQMNSQIII